VDKCGSAQENAIKRTLAKPKRCAELLAAFLPYSWAVVVLTPLCVPSLLRLLPSVSSSPFLAERTAEMPAPRKPASPHRLSLKLGPWFEAHGTGGGVLAIVFVVVGFGLGRALGFW